MSGKEVKTPKISAHMVVKNEENWIWYSIMSVIDYVDEINIIDTGSSDRTLEIINSIKSPKIKLLQKIIETKDEFTKLRNLQLNSCKSEWVLILDGDEVWTETSLRKSIQQITQKENLDYLISSYINCIGDVYHVLPASSGKYRIKTYSGNISIRWIKNKNVEFSYPYGQEGLVTINNKTLIQDSDLNYEFISEAYFHMTHLKRSSTNVNEVFMRKNKYKYELGSKNLIEFPKVFYLVRPSFVISPWKKRSSLYILNAVWQTPLKRLKRLIFNA